MRRIYIILLVMIFSIVSFASAQELTVAVAANMQFAFKEIKAAYEKNTGIKINEVISSSGKLTAQIVNGAPYDIFISADMKNPQVLFERGYAAAEPKIYAYGALVLWTMYEKDLSAGLNALRDEKTKAIALADPKTAPYGQQAVKALKQYGIFEDVQGRLIYGQDISQVNQYIASGGADIGFTSKSAVLSFELKDKGRWIEVDPGLYEPIAQGCIVLKRIGGASVEAEKLYHFLFSETARTILKTHGYNVP